MQHKIYTSQKQRLRSPPIIDDPSYLFKQADDAINISPKRYIENKNNTTFSHPIDMTRDGYIFPVLPSPYDYVQGENINGVQFYDIEIAIPNILTPYTPRATRIRTYVPKALAPEEEVVEVAAVEEIIPVKSSIPSPGPTNSKRSEKNLPSSIPIPFPNRKSRSGG